MAEAPGEDAPPALRRFVPCRRPGLLKDDIEFTISVNGLNLPSQYADTERFLAASTRDRSHSATSLRCPSQGAPLQYCTNTLAS